jgi:RNA polymerase sigma-70 factor (ECF subfamily)
MTGSERNPTACPEVELPASKAERRLVRALRQGDERAFSSLIDQYHVSLVRMAMCYVLDRAVAEEVAQETWLAVITGIERFAGRCSLKTWLFTILTNRAKTRGKREGRSIPFSALDGGDDPAVDLERFASDGPWQGHWASPPRRWDDSPEHRLLAGETQAVVASAIAALPATQRQVITLRDVEGWSAAEVCTLLGLAETHQRVLLHRARSRVRGALERYFDVAAGVPA